MTIEKDYVLGTHDEEIERLGLQHRVWRPLMLDGWRRAGITVGQTVVDVGCGPGHAALDLAEIVGPSGRVVAVDRSRRFLDALAGAAAARGLSQVVTHELDLDQSDLPAAQADAAWSRWAVAFVREPRRLAGRIARALRPGGVFVSHEYCDYRTWRLVPRAEPFERFVSRVIETWRASGGEPDIGLDLPRWLAEEGFEIRSLRPILDVVSPASFVWQWPAAFVDAGLKRLLDLGRMTHDQAAEVRASFSAAATDPRSLMFTPAVLETIAVRKG
jgi:SAM-dependent methyltransferase